MIDSDYENLFLLLNQKEILIKDIMDLTKRIDIEVKQDEFVLDQLLADRQNRIDRVIRCDKLITQALEESEDKAHINRILKGKTEKTNNEYEQKIKSKSDSIRNYFSRTLEIDKEANTILLSRREEARKMLEEISKN